MANRKIRSTRKSTSSSFLNKVWGVLNTPITFDKKEGFVEPTELELISKDIEAYSKDVAKLSEKEKEINHKAHQVRQESLDEHQKALKLKEDLETVANAYVLNSENVVVAKKELSAAEKAAELIKKETTSIVSTARTSALEKIQLANTARMNNMSVEEYLAHKAQVKAQLEADKELERQTQLDASVEAQPESLEPEELEPVALEFVLSSFNNYSNDIVIAFSKGGDITLNLEEAPIEESQRLVDMISGIAIANSYMQRRLGQKLIFVFSKDQDRLDNMMV